MDRANPEENAKTRSQGYWGGGDRGTLFISPATLFRESRMTGIGAVAAEWGFLIAADGRMTQDDPSKAVTPPKDNARKIFSITDTDRTIAYALAGSIANDDFTFDVRDEFKEQAAKLSSASFMSSDQYVMELGDPVAAAITRARYFPESNGKHEGLWKVVEVVLGGWFASSVFMIVADIRHMDQVARFRITHLSQGPTRDAILFGSSLVKDKMYDYRFDPVLNSTLNQYTVDLGEKPTIEQAQQFATGYIEACRSEEGQRIDPEGCERIGGHIHVAAVTQGSGFRFIIPLLEECP
jgi:hypothetical protein